MFTPKHPKTKPTVQILEEAEKSLDVDALISRAIENTKVTVVRF